MAVSTSGVACHDMNDDDPFPSVKERSRPPSRHELPAVITVVTMTFADPAAEISGRCTTSELHAAHGVVSSIVHTMVEFV